MITLRTVEIETENDTDSILTNLQSRTEKLEINFLNFFYFFFRSNISRQWLGQIDHEYKKFKLIRNKGQIEYGVRFSGVVSKGQIIKNSNKNLIKINLQPSGYVFFNNLGLIIMTIIGVVLIPIDAENWWALLIWTLLLLSNFIYVTIDLNKTEEKLIEYFDKQTTDT